MSNTIRVLGIDLACRRWEDTGTAVLSFSGGEGRAWEQVRTGVINWPAGPVTAEAMAELIDATALEHGAAAVSIDGPHGWRDPDAEPRPGVGRWCEHLSSTQGKTGTYGVTYPGTQQRWFRLSIEVFERLVATGRASLVNEPEPTQLSPLAPGKYWLIECFPTRTWKSGNLVPLPGKSARPPADVAGWAASLWQRYGLPETETWSGSHDDLQAVVACLPAAGLLGANCEPTALGNPGRWVDATENQPRHWVEGLIWDAKPPRERLGITIEQPRPGGPEEPTPSVETDSDNPILVDDREDGEEAISRGVRLFEYLVRTANDGDSVGIGYAQFVCFIHGVAAFQDIANRQYLPSDTPHVVMLAHQVTMAAGGRKLVSRENESIRAGMDTFIWSSKSPHPRPQQAFESTPYSEQQWQAIFPDETRRLISPDELETPLLSQGS